MGLMDEDAYLHSQEAEMCPCGYSRVDEMSRGASAFFRHEQHESCMSFLWFV